MLCISSISILSSTILVGTINSRGNDRSKEVQQVFDTTYDDEE
jgi:hypothetical protein